MTKKIITSKEVAHLYLGCKILTKEGTGTFNGLFVKDRKGSIDLRPITSFDLVKADLKFSEIKPILKSILLMNQKDLNLLGWASVGTYYNDPYMDEFSIEDFKTLLSLGYDLFNLIDNKEAILNDTQL